MKNPFSLTKRDPPREPGRLRDIAFSPAERAVWDELTPQERVAVLFDMANGPRGMPKLLGPDGKLHECSVPTIALVLFECFGLDDVGTKPLLRRLKAQFDLAREQAAKDRAP